MLFSLWPIIKSVWDEYSNYRSCTCGHQVEDCSMSYLMGLNDTYATVRGHILLMDPIPFLPKCFLFGFQMRSKRKLVLERSYKLTQLLRLLWQQRTILQRTLLRASMGAPNAPTVVFWVMWLINAINCMVTPLVISSNPRVNKLVLLLTMLLLLKIT